METGAARHGPLAPERLSHPARVRRAPTDATRTMLDRLIIGWLNSAVACLAVRCRLLAAQYAFYAGTHLDIAPTPTACSPAAAGGSRPTSSTRSPQFNDLVGGDRRARADRRTPLPPLARRAGERSAHRSASRMHRPSCARRPAVPRHEAVDRPDGLPIDAQPFLGQLVADPSARGLTPRAFTARHGRDQGDVDLGPYLVSLEAFHRVLAIRSRVRACCRGGRC